MLTKSLLSIPQSALGVLKSAHGRAYADAASATVQTMGEHGSFAASAFQAHAAAVSPQPRSADRKVGDDATAPRCAECSSTQNRTIRKQATGWQGASEAFEPIGPCSFDDAYKGWLLVLEYPQMLSDCTNASTDYPLCPTNINWNSEICDWLWDCGQCGTDGDPGDGGSPNTDCSFLEQVTAAEDDPCGWGATGIVFWNDKSESYDAEHQSNPIDDSAPIRK